jgi:hypothetical protein
VTLISVDAAREDEHPAAGPVTENDASIVTVNTGASEVRNAGEREWG